MPGIAPPPIRVPPTDGPHRSEVTGEPKPMPGIDFRSWMGAKDMAGMGRASPAVAQPARKRVGSGWLGLGLGHRIPGDHEVREHAVDDQPRLAVHPLVGEQLREQIVHVRRAPHRALAGAAVIVDELAQRVAEIAQLTRHGFERIRLVEPGDGSGIVLREVRTIPMNKRSLCSNAAVMRLMSLTAALASGCQCVEVTVAATNSSGTSAAVTSGTGGAGTGGAGTGGAGTGGAGTGGGSMAPPEPCTKIAWHKTFGGVGSQEIDSVVVDPADNIIMAGRFGGAMLLDGEMITGQGISLFVIKLDPAGNMLWHRVFDELPIPPGPPDTGLHDPFGGNILAADPQGNIYVPTKPWVDVDYGTGVFPPGSHVVKLAPDGTTLWAKDGVSAVAVGADGYLYLSAGTFIQRLDLDGNVVSTKTFPNVMESHPRRIAADAQGNVTLLTLYGGKADFGADPVVETECCYSYMGQCVAHCAGTAYVRMLGDSTVAWVRQPLGTTSKGLALRAAVLDGHGRFLVAGWHGVESWSPAGDLLWSSQLTPSCLWNPGAPLWDVAEDGSGSPWVLGTACAAIMAAGQLYPKDTRFWIKLNPSGQPLCGRDLGPGLLNGALAMDSTGAMILAGTFGVAGLTGEVAALPPDDKPEAVIIKQAP